MRQVRCASVTLAVAVLIGTAPQAQRSTPTAIVGARPIDGTGAAPVDDSVVIVEGDGIRAAGSRTRIHPAGRIALRWTPFGTAVIRISSSAPGLTILPMIVVRAGSTDLIECGENQRRSAA